MFLKNKTIQLAKQGNQQAKEKLYTDHIQGLYVFVRSRVNTPEQAEDICSECFLKAFDHIQTFQEKSSFKSWLYSIAYRLILDFYKQNAKEVKIENFDPAEEIEEEQEHLSQPYNIASVLEVLSENYRTVLELRFLSALNVKETAEVMHITPGNVKVLQNRALKKAKLIATNIDVNKSL